MSQAEFDRHAEGYAQQHRQNIALTGEEPAYFADYKMRDFKSLVDTLGLPANGVFLDYGSGVGASIEPFRAHLPRATLACADVSAESLELSRQTHGELARYAWMAEGKLPFGEDEFDGAFACCVFHHIPHGEHVNALAEIRRVVRAGGLLMVYEHNPLNPLTVRAVRTCPFDENAELVGPRQLMCSAALAGWQPIRRDYRVFFPAALAALRPLEQRLRWLPLGAQYLVALRA